MWREFAQGLESSCTFFPPASEQQFEAVERTLGIALPEDLRSLLAETNGIVARYTRLILNVDDLIETNSSFWTDPDYTQMYMPFVHLLFFAEAGNGDLFAFPIIGGDVRNSRIYAWDHETDGRAYVAFALKDFLEEWLKGRIIL
jgi:hypothetical protein